MLCTILRELSTYLHNMYITFSYRMKLVCIFLCIILVTGCLAYEDETCEEEIQRKIESFVKGKDWKALFKKYANYKSGYIENDEMGDFLIDIGVSDWCQWPTQVLAKLDPNNDGKLSFEEISSLLTKMQRNEL